jgi:hypothetical protein
MRRYAGLKVPMVLTVLALSVACSGNAERRPTGPTPVTTPPRQTATPISQSQVEAIVRRVDQQVNQAIANAFSRISFRGEGDAPLFQPSLINVPISVSAPCTNGGRVGITGSMSGNDPVGSTFTLLMQITATLTDCREGNLVINGDPYLSTAGTFRMTANIFNGDMRSGGGFRFTGDVAGSCAQNITTTMNANGGRSSGTVDCRGAGWSTVRSVNVQF